MLGNQVELWDVMLAVMKLGAVIMPTTTAAGPADLADRVARGGARAVVTTPDRDREVRRGARCRPRAGQRRRRPTAGPTCTTRTPSTSSRCRTRAPRPGDPLLLYFTSGTTARPKLVEHTQVSYPVGPPVDGLLARPAARRRAPQHLQPGWAKHAWSCFFAPWIAEATIFVYNYARFDAGAAARRAARRTEVTSFCAPPTVWRMLINADLSGGPGSLREVIGAGEPLNPEVIEQVRRAWGLRPARRLRPDRDDGRGRQHPRVTAQARARWAGRCPGVPVVLVDPLTRRARRRRRGRARSASTSPPTRCR